MNAGKVDPVEDSSLINSKRDEVRNEPAFKEFIKGVTHEKPAEFVNDPTQISKQYNSFAARFGKEAGAEKKQQVPDRKNGILGNSL